MTHDRVELGIGDFDARDRGHADNAVANDVSYQLGCEIGAALEHRLVFTVSPTEHERAGAAFAVAFRTARIEDLLVGSLL